jgi:UDP-N-acetylmuramate: L-alanyl-gamma-D-glutamyl-meso-diaminopimelate ligase
MKVHFIAIGGSVMHQLAIALRHKGYSVTGSDDEIFEPAKDNLNRAGILPAFMGWFPEKITTALDAVILGMHARADNPEIIKARELGLHMYSFPEYIFQESLHKTRIVVGGSHGKTTTTSMIMHVLRKCGKVFDYLVGAKLEGFERSVNISDAPLIVCEGDEYPASVLDKRPKFHFLFPHIAVLTGIAWDHINVFPTFDIYLEQFKIFIDKIEPGGLLIYNETDPVLRKLVEEHPSPVKRSGYSAMEHHNDQHQAVVSLNNQTARLKIFGNHNMLNLQAAYLVCHEVGIEAGDFLLAVEDFTGASKRLELIAERTGFQVYRDFAHAPSKVKATMDAMKNQYPDRKLVAVLELHTFSSLNAQFMREYHQSLELADVAVVFYSQHALELKKLPALNPEEVYEGFGKKDLLIFNNTTALQQWMLHQDYENTTLLLMSSGNYDGMDIVTFAAGLTGREQHGTV